jgi:multidrug efflux pump
MKFTDLFIQRPVLASVVSLLILVVGLRSFTVLDLREFPEISNTVVSVTTVYPGASSELMQGFITTPLQQAIAEASGIDFIVSRSSQGVSLIEAHMPGQGGQPARCPAGRSGRSGDRLDDWRPDGADVYPVLQ